MRTKFLSILVCAMMAVFASACTNKTEKQAKDFAEAVNKHDTTKINQVLSPRTAIWSGVAFASINPEQIKPEKAGEGQFKVSTGSDSYFILSPGNDEAYKIIKVKNILTIDKEKVAKAVEKGLLTGDYDDIDAMVAVKKLDEQEAQQKKAAEAKAEKEKAIIGKLRRLYTLYVLGNNNFTASAADYCTARMRNKLEAANDYEGGGYAMWELRTGVQDGDGPSKVVDITPLSGGWYQVSYTDMGFSGKTKIKAIEKDGNILFDDYKYIGKKYF